MYSVKVVYTTIRGEAYNSVWCYGSWKSKSLAEFIAKTMAFIHDKLLASRSYGVIWKVY